MKVAVWLFLAISTGFVILTGSAIAQSTGSAKDDARAHVRTTAVVAGVAIGREMDAVTALVKSYALRPSLERAAAAEPAPGPNGQITEQLAQLVNANRGIRAAFISSPEGVLRDVFPASPQVVGQNFSYRDWYVGLKRTGGPYVSSAYQTAILDHPLVVAAVAYIPDPVAGGSEEPVGILSVVYALDEMRGLTDEVGTAQGVGLTVLDQRGDVVADSGRTPSEIQPYQPRPDGDQLGVTVDIKSIGWTVRAQMPLAVALSGVHRLQNTVLVVVGAFVLLLGAVVLFAIWLIRRARAAEIAATSAEARALDILEASNDGYLAIDAAGRILEWNGQAAKLLGWPREVAVGAPVAELLVPSRFRTDYLARLTERAGGAGRTAAKPVEVPVLHRCGHEVIVEVSFWTVGEGQDRTYSAFLRDISERRRYEQQLRAAARTDPLTGAGNRLRLSEDLDALDARARRYQHSYSIALIDIDDFKSYNDTYGHLAGDDVLRAVATELDAAARGGDALYRYGGEEFIVVLPEQPLGGAARAGERLRSAIEGLGIAHLTSRFGQVTVSVGVATLVQADEGAEALLGRADLALYESKHAGRNRVEAAQIPLTF